MNLFKEAIRRSNPGPGHVTEKSRKTARSHATGQLTQRRHMTGPLTARSHVTALALTPKNVASVHHLLKRYIFFFTFLFE